MVLLRSPALRLVAVVAFVSLAVATPKGRGEEVSESDADRTSISVRVVDASGDPIDARVRLVPLDLVSRVDASLSGYPGETDLAVRGRLDRSVEAGRYRIIASHGPEFSIARREVTVRDGSTTSIRLRIERVVEPGRYRAADFHVHTDASDDGRVGMRKRIASLRAEGIALASITDHNHVSVPPARSPGDPWIVPGVEVTTWAPEVGHFNVFPADRVPEHRGRTPDGLFTEVHRHPTRLVQVNHPRLLDHIAYFGLADLRSGGRTRAGFGLDFDLLEVWNGYDLADAGALWSVFREWLDLVASGHPIVATGNSDSHDVGRTWAGFPRTYVEGVGDVENADTLLDSLAAGRSYVTTGPLLDVRVGDARPGDSVAVRHDRHVDVRVRVMAAPYVDVDRLEIWLDRRWVRSIRVPRGTASVRIDRTLSVDVGRARNLVVAVRGDEPMRDLLPGRTVRPAAFTNPIRLVHATGLARNDRALRR